MSQAGEIEESGRAALRALFGFEDFRPGQLEAVTRAFTGQDAMVLMPTGAGKSLCYELPALVLDGCTVVISPLIALMKDQMDSLPPVLAKASAAINSSVPRDELRRNMARLRDGELKLVYAAPERLRRPPFLDALRRAHVSLFVVDEMHCVSLWGHDFRPEYLFLREALELLGRPPVMGLSATATPATALEVSAEIGRELPRISTGVLRPNLWLSVENVRNDAARQERVVDLCERLDGAGIVYVNAQARAELLAQRLRSVGVQADFYHAGLASVHRSAAQDRFMSGESRVVVSTVALGLGVDKANVRFVIHCDVPSSLESYVQEIGRAGRDGQPSRCVALVAPGDRGRLSRWMHRIRPTLPLLRTVDGILRRSAEQNVAYIAVDDLVREVQDALDIDVDETETRVGVSMLERVGLVRRHLDTPRALSIRVDARPGPGSDLGDFVARAKLPIGGWLDLSARELAARSGVRILELEERLLEWQARSCVSYRVSGRDLCIELLPGREDADERLQGVIDTLADRQEARIEAMFGYVEERGCRHTAVARYFDVPPPEQCSACDCCKPEPIQVQDIVARIWRLVHQHTR